MVDLLIDEIEQTVLDKLELRAKSKGQTLEEEVRKILTDAAARPLLYIILGPYPCPYPYLSYLPLNLAAPAPVSLARAL